MNKIDNMALFVRVVKTGGLAAAGRQIGLSPASMTARMNALEQHYNTRLLNRTTRKISLTDAGQRFYQACLRVLSEMEAADASLTSDQACLSGQLRITATSDFGRQFVAPALVNFVEQHPNVKPYLYLTDGVINLIDQGFDLGVRFGNLPDSNLVSRHLANNRRVLVASAAYLKRHGTPQQPQDLQHHQCLVMERLGEPLNEWQFSTDTGRQTVKVNPAFVSNDGAIIRQWALAGTGIAYKSIWDVKHDLASKELLTVLEDFSLGFQVSDDNQTGLQLVYPSRQFVPRPVAGFIDFIKEYLTKEEKGT
ncbi:MAG: LysR family transcriptional regulator [Gammaproteobacteria bacterium]|nr:LysR family transcriptional regulator [Gammaproteobacteria bacterium]